jgi:hypothetical protein
VLFRTLSDPDGRIALRFGERAVSVGALPCMNGSDDGFAAAFRESGNGRRPRERGAERSAYGHETRPIADAAEVTS